MTKLSYFLTTLSFLLMAIACTKDAPKGDTASNDTVLKAGANAADDAQLAFIETANETTIRFEAGQFSFTNTLSMDGKKKIRIKGAGRDKTILDFSGQTSGGDGVLVTNSESIRFEDLTIRDAKGDALKTRDCKQVSFVNVGTVWSGEPDSTNGAYGLYPVLCSEVFIDRCYAYGASDAGIYVGQSDQVIIKNSVAEGNVAGIEIENTTNADVFDNQSFDNTGGILVFDLPGLTKYGKGTRVFDNKCYNNNRPNFAPKGNIVASVPTGTGCMVLSTKDVEIFNNQFTDNNFTNILIANYLVIKAPPKDPKYNPFPSGIFIHDNQYQLSGAVDMANQTPTTQAIIGVLKKYGFGQPQILADGLLQSPDALCIQEAGIAFVNLNAADQTFSKVTQDIQPHNCKRESLSEINFEQW